jgi:hypothetical protein
MLSDLEPIPEVLIYIRCVHASRFKNDVIRYLFSSCDFIGVLDSFGCAKWIDKRSQKGEGFEYHLLAIAIAIALVVRGGGKWALDTAIDHSLPANEIGRLATAYPPNPRRLGDAEELRIGLVTRPAPAGTGHIAFQDHMPPSEEQSDSEKK